MKFEPFVLKSIANESQEVRTFRFARPDGSTPAYQPGHFFLLRLPDENGKLVQRSYSAASHPSEPLLSFCIKLKGTFTHLLWKLKEGDTVDVDGPYGVFLLRADDTERIFVGGGVGVSALRSHLIQTIKEGKRCFLFHSAKTFENLTYYTELKNLAEQTPAFTFIPSITGEVKPERWGGGVQRISVEMIKNLTGGVSGKTFYLCGSKEMVAELANALMAEGVPKELILKDDWA
ncbi:MAG: FAD-binding oxidoreductase [Candidatus Anstonellaceae archaeon]